MNLPFERRISTLESNLGFYFGRLLSYPLIPPEHIYFSVTNRCNLNCIMCDVVKKPSKIDDELTTIEIKRIVPQISAMGIKHLIFSGGEPFLRKDLLEIAEFAITNNIDRIDIITNGTLLNDNIIKELIKIKLNHLTISLDGLKENNDKIRGQGVFDKAGDAIGRINYYKSRYASSFPTVGINFTIMDKNIDDILPMIEFARNRKFNAIVFQPVLFNNTNMYERKKNTLWPSESKISKLNDIIKGILLMENPSNGFYICSERDILEAMPNYFMGTMPSIPYKCYETIKRIVISCDGTLWSCRGVYGDLTRNALKEVWLSEGARRVREAVKECNNHCLQDCIYSSSDILEELARFFGKTNIDNNQKVITEERIFQKLEEYSKLLYTKAEISS